MSGIHPSAVIEPGAIIGEGCEIGPFCVVGPDVKLGDRVVLKSHVVVTGDTEIGDDTVVFSFAVIGEIPQDLKFRGEKCRLVIGKRNRIREHVTMNPGTEGGGGLTQIGDDGLFMAGCHIAHDARVGNNVIVVNSAAVAGHCVLEDNVIIGGLSGIHQFVRIGRGAIVGAVTSPRLGRRSRCWPRAKARFRSARAVWGKKPTATMCARLSISSPAAATARS
jgi:UDP-N-acetylglucosamine acyltransferase